MPSLPAKIKSLLILEKNPWKIELNPPTPTPVVLTQKLDHVSNIPPMVLDTAAIPELFPTPCPSFT